MQKLKLPPNTRKVYSNLWPCKVQFRMPHPFVENEGRKLEENCLYAKEFLKQYTRIFVQPYGLELLPNNVRIEFNKDNGGWLTASRMQKWKDDFTELGALPDNFAEAFIMALNDTETPCILRANVIEKGSLLKANYLVHSREGALIRDGSLHYAEDDNTDNRMDNKSTQLEAVDPKEVIDMAREDQQAATSPPSNEEYEVMFPVTSHGLLFKVSPDIDGSAVFHGFLQYPDGSKGPAERYRWVRNVGDRIVAVNQVSTAPLSYTEVISLLRNCKNKKCVTVRFQASGCSIMSSLPSVPSTSKRHTVPKADAHFTEKSGHEKSTFFPWRAALTPPSEDEYDTVLPVSAEYGLMIRMGDLDGMAIFSGYIRYNGSKGPAELRKLIRNKGDLIVAVNGVMTSSFPHVCRLIRESKKNADAHCFIRFRDIKSKSFAAKVTDSIASNGSAMPLHEPKMTEDRFYRRPTSRSRKRINWDAMKGIWVPSSRDATSRLWGKTSSHIPSLRKGTHLSMAMPSQDKMEALANEELPGYVSIDAPEASYKSRLRKRKVINYEEDDLWERMVTNNNEDELRKRKVIDYAEDDGTDNGMDNKSAQLKTADAKKVIDTKAEEQQAVTSLAPPSNEEYDVVFPVTPHGLLFKVSPDIDGSTRFYKYSRYPDGSKGPAELNHWVQNVGDRVVAVNQVSTFQLSFTEVVSLLRNCKNKKFVTVRFQVSGHSIRSSLPSDPSSHKQHTVPPVDEHLTALTPPSENEYDTVLPISAEYGLMIRMGDLDGMAVFTGYSRYADGRKGPAELRKVIRNEGDRIVAVNGVMTSSFAHMCHLIQESKKNADAHCSIRFREMTYAAKLRDRTAYDGSVMPLHEPRMTKDGNYMRPAGRTRKDMRWDAVRGIWVRLSSP